MHEDVDFHSSMAAMLASANLAHDLFEEALAAAKARTEVDVGVAIILLNLGEKRLKKSLEVLKSMMACAQSGLILNPPPGVIYELEHIDELLRVLIVNTNHLWKEVKSGGPPITAGDNKKIVELRGAWKCFKRFANLSKWNHIRKAA